MDTLDAFISSVRTRRPSLSEKKALNEIASWQNRAQATAEQYRQHQNKKAVRETGLSDREQQAARVLFAEYAPLIAEICADVYNAHSKSGHADEPGLALRDVLQESWILFLRALVPYDPAQSSLSTYLSVTLPSKVRHHLQTRLVTPDDPDRRSAVPDRSTVAPIDLAGLVEEMIESDRAQRLWKVLDGEHHTTE